MTRSNEGARVPPPRPTLSRAQLVRAMLPSAVMVEDLAARAREGGSRVVGTNVIGTAFVADERGYYLTAKHVVGERPPAELELRTNYGRSGEYAMLACRSVEAVYPHPELDVAVLAAPATYTRGRVKLPMSSAGVFPGEDVVLMGYAFGTQFVFCDDILGAGSAKSLSPVAFAGAVCARIPDDGRPVRLYAYDCTTFEGNSGAPVLCVATGAVIGVHLRSQMNHVGYALPIEVCLDFLGEVADRHDATRAR